MPLTAKEKMRRYRERLKRENPEKFEEQRKKNLARIKSKKKRISEMTQAEAESKRKEWRDEKRISRQRQHDNNRPSPMPVPQNRTTEQEQRTEENKIKKIKKKLQLAQKQDQQNKALINKMKTKIECYKKRMQRSQQQASKTIASLQKTLDIVKARNEILEASLKASFSNCRKHSEKQLLKRVVRNSKNKQYTSKVLGLKVTARFKPKKAKKNKIPEIKVFFVRDDVSRITSGKKECRVKNKNKQQIRYLIDSIPNLHRKYRAEGGRYGITTFYKHKPFFVLSPHIQSRSTCLCERHENIKFQYESLRRHRIINDDFDKLLQELVCDTKKLECMYNKCEKCKNKTPTFAADQDILFTVNWNQWERQDHAYTKKGGTIVHTKKTVRATKTDTAQKLMDDFSRDIIAFKKHHYNNIHQQKEYQKAVTNMKATEAVIICDFSENYQSKLTEEIQSMHFGASKSQISLHTGMIYLKNRSQSFCTISDNLTHQPPAIWAHLTPILHTVKEMSPDINVIHYYSDGPTSQYRQKNNFFLHSLFTRQLNLSYSTWSFFEAGHGKSVADGIGGNIKRMLDMKVCHGVDIKNARDAYEAIKQSETIIQVHLIEEEAINAISNKIPDNIRVLPGTMKVHQIITDTQTDSHKIKYRDVSCFCEPLRGKCSCFSLGEHYLQLTNSDPIQPILSCAELDDAELLHDLVEFDLPSRPPSCSILTEDIALFDTVDKEEKKDIMDSTSSILDSALDIDKLPFIILPISPGLTSEQTNAHNTPKFCTSKRKMNFQNCNKCRCTILSQVAKCMACKQFYCEDCVGGGPSFFDYICDKCFQDSED